MSKKEDGPGENYHEAAALIKDKGNMLDILMSAMGDGLSIQDLDMRIVYQNKFMADTFGNHTGEYCYRVYEGRDTVCEGCPIRAAYADGQVHKALRVGIVAGRPLRFENIASPLKNNMGKILAGMELVRLVEDREKARSDLQSKIQELKLTQMQLIQSGKMSAVGQLASGVAHEINNPLGIILGFAQSVVKRIKNADDPLALPLRTIEREALRCKDLVQNLLVFSRTSKNEKLEETDLNAAVESALSLIAAQTKAHNVELVRQPAGDIPKIHANITQLQQILINLANNAVDSMSKGGTLTVKTALSGRRPGHVEIQVRDTGSGIPKELQKKIFEPFFTTKEVGKGTGLGLSLVYEIVTKHGGTIELESEEGMGTAFTVFLPVNPSGGAV